MPTSIYNSWLGTKQTQFIFILAPQLYKLHFLNLYGFELHW